jgi:hypothetical protein
MHENTGAEHVRSNAVRALHELIAPECIELLHPSGDDHSEDERPHDQHHAGAERGVGDVDVTLVAGT